VRREGKGKDSVVFWMPPGRGLLHVRNIGTKAESGDCTHRTQNEKASPQAGFDSAGADYFWLSTQATRVLASAALTCGLGGMGI
jgi:hypothetical protein